MRLLTDGALGIVGLAKESDATTDISFDILSLEALFLVPRYRPLKLDWISDGN